MKKSNYVHALLWAPAVVGSFYLETFWYAKIRYIREVSFFDYRLTIIAVSMLVFTISMLLIYKIQERERKKVRKEKQIEEMAEDIGKSDFCKHLPKELCNKRSCSQCMAEIIYEAGYRKMPENIGELSDGYHTFNELYHHRAVLFSVICNMFPEKAWKSKLHDTGDMYEGMFIVGIETEQGQATYHYDIEPYWDMFKVKELEKAPKYDGHTPSDAIERIGNLPCAGYRKQSEDVTDINVGCKSEWISVEERLPDKEGTYLVYTDKDNITMDIFCIYPSHGTKFWVGGINGEVTHWMPLPEAPKGGAE